MDIIAKIKSYTERKIQDELKWRSSFLAFSFYGTFVYFISKKEAIFNLDSYLFSEIMTVLTIGFLFGNTLTFSISYLMKLTSKLFRVNVTVKKIINVFTIAYKPHLISVLLVIFSIIMNHYIDSNLYQDNPLIIFCAAILVYLIFAVVSIFSLIIKFYGLMLVLNLTLSRTIVCFLSATIIFSPFYILLLKI
jgi:hypothetical protein